MSDYERAARYLFDLLDDISTCGDAYRPTIGPYFRAIERLCEKRFDVASVDIDGQGVTFK